jgi:hypothetical protein
MRSFKLLFAVVVLALAAFAQEGPVVPVKGNDLQIAKFPGQAWVSFGTQSPAERGNFQAEAYAEQGVTIYKRGTFTITPYLSLGIAGDLKGYDWNDKAIVTGGIKANKFFRHGVVSVGTGYAFEGRFLGGVSRGVPVAYVQDWFGWHPVSNKSSRFPGSTWAVLGNIAPSEKNNLIALGYLQQGIIMHRIGKMAIVPYGEITLGYDSQGYDWERKALYGTGVKVVRPIGNQYVELGAGYTHENRYQSGLSANGLKVFLNASFAWHLFKF